jgi:hypothetical protein
MSQFKRGTPRMGWTPVWVTDEHGCSLHTEPVCTVPDEHYWFLSWIEQQAVTQPFLSLIHHEMEVEDA